jgi:hypothetical protein
MKPLTLIAIAFLILNLTKVADVLAKENREPAPAKPLRTLDLSKFDIALIKQFRNAWHVSKCGTSHSEGVVLIYRLQDGSYRGDFLGASNEFKQFTFTINSAVIAVVHTHPNTASAKPSPEDIDVANKYGVLMFTITLKGMFVYDPFTKKTRNVMDGVDWLEPAKWTNEVALKMAKLSDSFALDPSPLLARQYQEWVGWL